MASIARVPQVTTFCHRFRQQLTYIAGICRTVVRPSLWRETVNLALCPAVLCLQDKKQQLSGNAHTKLDAEKKQEHFLQQMCSRCRAVIVHS